MEEKSAQKTRININLDNTPILYTDRIAISVNQNGVVFDVMQRLGRTDTIRIVSRIGMSREHAIKFAQELGKLLAVTQSDKSGNKKKN